MKEAIATYLNKTMYEPFRRDLQGLLSEIMYLDKIRCDIKNEVSLSRSALYYVSLGSAIVVSHIRLNMLLKK